MPRIKSEVSGVRMYLKAKETQETGQRACVKANFEMTQLLGSYRNRHESSSQFSSLVFDFFPQ